MFVCCGCCVLSVLCDELITRPEESYRPWCVVVGNVEASRIRGSWSALGRSARVVGGGLTKSYFTGALMSYVR